MCEILVIKNRFCKEVQQKMVIINDHNIILIYYTFFCPSMCLIIRQSFYTPIYHIILCDVINPTSLNINDNYFAYTPNKVEWFYFSHLPKLYIQLLSRG